MRLAPSSARTRLALALAGIAALAALGAALPRLARAQASPTPAPPAEPAPYRGPRWEARVLALSAAEYNSDEFKAIVKEVGGDPWRAAYLYQERILAQAGGEGWELVQVAIPNEKVPSNVVFYWKRMVVK